MFHAGRLPRCALAIAFGLMVWATSARAEIIDRIAAVVEGQVITTGDVERLIRADLIPRREGEQETDYRRRVLSTAIDFLLQRRDAERFGLKDVRPADVDARIEILARADGSKEAMFARLSSSGMDETNLRQIIQRRLQIDAYIEERFAPLIFISLDEIERYYRESWSQQRRDAGQPVPPLAEVREQLRESLRSEGLEQEVRRWTERLRNRANIDIYAFQ
jgi:peptidyl-prolyl cis-trans isomerase SurA